MNHPPWLSEFLRISAAVKPFPSATLITLTLRQKQYQHRSYLVAHLSKQIHLIILIHVSFSFVLFVLQPTNAQIHIAIFSPYKMFPPTFFDISVPSSGRFNTCTSLSYVSFYVHFKRRKTSDYFRSSWPIKKILFDQRLGSNDTAIPGLKHLNHIPSDVPMWHPLKL
jgi:hypothetical protein